MTLSGKEHIHRSRVIYDGVAAGLTDAQIGQQLGVAASTVANYRITVLRLPASNKFLRHFKERYGTESVTQFRFLADGGATFQTIGDYFGFSREYARQVYVKLYGKGKKACAIFAGSSQEWECG